MLVSSSLTLAREKFRRRSHSTNSIKVDRWLVACLCRQMIESTTVPRGVEAEGIMRLASFETMLVLASLTMLALVVMGG